MPGTSWTRGAATITESNSWRGIVTDIIHPRKVRPRLSCQRACRCVRACSRPQSRTSGKRGMRGTRVYLVQACVTEGLWHYQIQQQRHKSSCNQQANGHEKSSASHGPTSHGPSAAVATVSPRSALGKRRTSYSRTQSPRGENIKNTNSKKPKAQATRANSQFYRQKQNQASNRCQKRLVDDASVKR